MQQSKPKRGYIFACSRRTEDECLERMLFASNKVYENKVLQVKKGDILFLLNVETNNLHGVFRAETDGTKNIVPEAWKGKYPYQVMVSKNGEIKKLKIANIFSKLNITWDKPLEENKLEFILSLFENKKKKDWGSLVADISFKKSSNPLVDIDQKPPLETTTVWDYPTQSYGTKAKGDNTFPGVTPAFVIYNLVRRYTEVNDVILDPMAGSGTCIDVCNEEGRKCLAYDIEPVRSDIYKNDARNLPLDEDSIDMVFIDSPYSNNLHYNAHPGDIGKISAESKSFYIELSKVAKECHRVLKPGKVLAWLIADQYVKKEFTPVGFNLYNILQSNFDTLDVICLIRRGQASNSVRTGQTYDNSKWYSRSVLYNFYLRGFKYLFIMRKPLSGDKKMDISERKIKWKQYPRKF